MNITNIIYYTRKHNAVTNTTLSLRDLCLREGFDLEDIFYAVKDATDPGDLLFRLRRIVHESIEFDSETASFIVFTVTDAYGNNNCLKLKKKKEM